MSIKTQATIEDLYRVPENGKAEIVNGELRLMSPTGALPNRAAGEIFVSLRAHARRTGEAAPIRTMQGLSLTCPTGSHSAPTPPTTLARIRVASSCRVLLSLRWKCGVKTTTVPRQSGRWPPSVATISAPAPRWYGMPMS